MQTKYECELCNMKFNTKTDRNKHLIIIHQVSDDKSSTKNVLLDCVLQLSKQCEEMKKKIEELEKVSYRFKKKSVEDYLKSQTNLSIEYALWAENLIITPHDLDYLFEKDLKDCIKHLLNNSIQNTQPSPIISFKQKQHTIYIYENNSWRIQKPEEFRSLILTISQRVLRKYIEWRKNNQLEIERDENMRNLDMLYMQKATGGSSSFDSRVHDIRKSFIEMCQISIQ